MVIFYEQKKLMIGMKTIFIKIEMYILYEKVHLYGNTSKFLFVLIGIKYKLLITYEHKNINLE